MSLAQQPAQTGFDTDPPRGRGERIAVIAGVLVTVLAVAGIAFILINDEDPAPLAAPSAVATPSADAPSTAPAVQTPEDLAAAAAQERYREFLRVGDEVGQVGFASAAPFDAVTVVPERAYQETALRNAQETPGLRQTGTTQVAALSVTSVDLTAEPGGYPKVVLQACLDVSGVDVIDGSGRSIVTPDREEQSKSTVTMYQYEPGTKGAEAGGWYVYEATALNESC